MVSRTFFAKQLKNFTGGRLLMMNALLNYIAAGSAGFANCFLMRYKETKDGIDVTNSDGSVVYGKSTVAG